VKTALNLLVFAVSISVWITDRECGKRTVPVCSMLEETKRDAPPNAKRRTVNATGKRLWLLLKWGHQQLILPRGLFGLFP
jgi:hypothetical protein